MLLVEELGVEPGPGLRQLNGQVLAADPCWTCRPGLGGRGPDPAATASIVDARRAWEQAQVTLLTPESSTGSIITDVRT